MQFKIPKGVFDILPQDPDPEGKWRESHLWMLVETIAYQICNAFGFKNIRPPIFESTELFQRSIGTGTDIVTKEMYTFQDKADRSLTLRPEGTASVLRAYVEKHLDQLPDQKFFYILPMFRYERQQAGRYRQHHQLGVEAIGSHSPYQDAEVIHLLVEFLNRLGIHGFKVQLNSIGNMDTRNAYRQALKDFLLPFFEELSLESQQRYHINPLRILDSKDPRDKKILQDSPSILTFLDTDSENHFASLCHILEDVRIPFEINTKLVRGLDYYNRTVFEVTSDALGAQNSLGGGGRYDGLLKTLGGPDLPAVGFGAGIERIILTLLKQQVPLPSRPHPTLFLIPLGDVAKKSAFRLTSSLRKQSINVEMELDDRKLKAALRYANAIQATFVAVLGEEELKTGTVELKEMSTGKSEKIALDMLSKRLKNDR